MGLGRTIFSKAFIAALPLGLAAFTGAPDAEACGGCFVQQSESTQVTGHLMVLSVSNERTSLWDQIVYDGDPASFAWVLPIKGTVDIGLSSDVLFQVLDQSTAVTVSSPQINCPPPPDCGFASDGASEGATGAGGGGGGPPPVEVLAQEVVGPYATVQLKSEDPNALKNWLLENGYNIPPDVAPVVDAYVNEGFNFLALKLVPGQGVSAMRPVRVTSQGALPVLPLRMVAAGTGAITPITLWVLGEGNYEPANFETFAIAEQDLVWDWDAQSSNYAALKEAGFSASGNKAWLIEAGEPMSTYQLGDPILSAAQYSPAESGYADAAGQGAVEAATEDLDHLYGSLDAAGLTVSRLHGQLSRAALGADLDLQASEDQTPVQRFFQAEKSVGTPPACPPPPSCSGSGDDGGVFGDIFGSGAGSDPGDGSGETDEGEGSGGGAGCALGGSPSLSALALLALAGASAAARRRRR